MKKLILFDVDKTLLTSSPSRGEVFSEAYKRVYNIDAKRDVINRHGMTDQQMIIESLKMAGLDERVILSKLSECIDAIDELYKENDVIFKVALLSEVKESLEILKKDENNILGLVTGNLESIAWSKLKKAGIDKYFSLGGFGSDAINREDLVRLVIEKAKSIDGDFEKIFLIGDAPQDIKAGKEAGIKTVGLTTGVYEKEDLEQVGADYVISNLKEILDII